MKSQKQISPIIRKTAKGSILLAPAVGMFSAFPTEGSYISPGAVVGHLTILNTSYNMYLPEDKAGTVAATNQKNLVYPVEYGEVLFEIHKVEIMGEGALKKGQKTTGKPAADQTKEKGLVIRAFSTGIFYAKPSPDAEPFVNLGQKIEKGKSLGLIEVMKTFNQIIFQGMDKSVTGSIKKIFVKDMQEVKKGDPLFFIG